MIIKTCVMGRQKQMTKIVLHKHPQADRYRAVIGDTGKGWAYPITQYMENGNEVLEATVIEQGGSGMASYRFAFDGMNWTTDIEPISHSSDWRARRWELI
jgi:hypothetical protein